MFSALTGWALLTTHVPLTNVICERDPLAMQLAMLDRVHIDSPAVNTWPEDEQA